MRASHSHQWLSKNHQRKWTKSSPVSFEVACVPSPLLCRARSTAARPGSLCWWLPKVLMHSGKTKLTSAFYLLMSNHHLYLSPAWDSAAWHTNAIRSWSLFLKNTHSFSKTLFNSLTFVWFLGFLGNKYVAGYEALHSLLPHPSIIEYLGVGVGIGSQVTWEVLDLPFQLTQYVCSNKSVDFWLNFLITWLIQEYSCLFKK